MFDFSNPINHLGGACQCSQLFENILPDRSNLENGVIPMIDTGRALYYQQNYDEAISILQQTDLNTTRQPLVDYFLGASYICLDDGIQAAQYWQHEEMVWRAFKGINRCQRAGEELRAATLYDLALTGEPDLAQAGYQLPNPGIGHYLAAADVARERDLLGMELNWLKIAYSLFPDKPLANYRLGEYFERSGDLALAKQYYGLALSYSTANDTSIYQHYIRVSFLLEDWTDGAAAAEKLLLKLQPTSEHHGRIVMALINQHLNPELCQQMVGLFNKVEQFTVGDIAEMLTNVQRQCATID